MSRVVVAGLGVMGAAAAWQLSRRGVDVTGLDRFSPPHARGSSHGGSRIIRETAFEGADYVPLVRRAYGLWSDLEQLSGRKLLLPTGALYLGAPVASVVTGSRASADAHGVPSELLDSSEVRRRYPAFAPEPGMVGLLEHRAGVLRPEECVTAMLARSRELGADLRVDEPLLDWRVDGGGVSVRTARGRLTADGLVLAMGAWMPDVVRRLGIRLEVERVVQHWFTPAGDPAQLEPERCPVYIWEDGDGVIFYGFPLLDGAVKCAIHHRGEITGAESVRRDADAAEVETVRAYAARFVPAAAGAHQRSTVCMYTNTPDGHFLVDHHPESPRVVIVSPCNGVGFKFAPAIGEGAALLLLEGAAPSDLAPFGMREFAA